MATSSCLHQTLGYSLQLQDLSVYPASRLNLGGESSGSMLTVGIFAHGYQICNQPIHACAGRLRAVPADLHQLLVPVDYLVHRKLCHTYTYVSEGRRHGACLIPESSSAISKG